MSSGNSLINAGFVFIIACLLAYVLNISVGTMVDAYIDAGVRYGLYHVSPEWDATPNVQRIVNMFYLIIYGLPIFGIVQFIYTAVRRQRYEEYVEAGAVYQP